ncbi:MAG: CPBP family intramembrane glutamic endopeptidase [Planctomycetota bacterium]
MNFLDYLLLLVLAIVWPVYAYINMRLHPYEKIKDDHNIRMQSYNESLLTLWGLCIAVLLTWLHYQRPFEGLGFRLGSGWGLYAAWGLAVAGVAFSFSQSLQVRLDSKVREKLEAQLRAVGEMTRFIMPVTDQENRRAMCLAITAGITEEVIFRGYLIWALGMFANPWLAGLGSVLLFVLLHLYQDKAGLVQVTGFAIVATMMYLISGSLWPCIFLHVGVDIFNIRLARYVWRHAVDSTDRPLAD